MKLSRASPNPESVFRFQDLWPDHLGSNRLRHCSSFSHTLPGIRHYLEPWYKPPSPPVPFTYPHHHHHVDHVAKFCCQRKRPSSHIVQNVTFVSLGGWPWENTVLGSCFELGNHPSDILNSGSLFLDEFSFHKSLWGLGLASQYFPCLVKSTCFLFNRSNVFKNIPFALSCLLHLLMLLPLPNYSFFISLCFSQCRTD